MAESIPQCGEWNKDPAQSEGHTTKLSRGIKVRRKPKCRIAPRRWDTTPCNYEMVPLIADSDRRLPSVNDYVYRGGTRTSRDPTVQSYGKAAPWIIDNFTADSARSKPSINGDAYGRWNSCPAHTEGYTTAFPTQTTELLAFQLCLITSPSRDSTSRNYGRAPLIEDLFADSARPHPPVRDDAFGGGFSTKYGQRDTETIVHVTNTGQRYNGESAPQVSFPIHPQEQKSTYRVNPTTTVHQPTRKSTDRLNPIANVYPFRKQNSTRQVNPPVKITQRNGRCLFCFI